MKKRKTNGFSAKEHRSPKTLCSRPRGHLAQIGAGGDKGSEREASELKREKEEQTDYLIFNRIGSLGSVGTFGPELVISILKIKQNEIIINFGENKLVPKKKGNVSLLVGSV